MNWFKNFFYTLRRFKLASTLNILGLSVAFAAFMVLMMQVHYESSFDKGYKNSGRIYRVEVGGVDREFAPVLARPLAEVFVTGISQIESYTLTQPFSNSAFMTTERNGARVGFKQTCVGVYPSFVDVFGVEFISGSEESFSVPNSVILPASLAQTMLGTTDCNGKSLEIESMYSGTITVPIAGVYKDFPAASSQTNSIYGNMGDENKDQWGNSNYYLFVTLAQGADVRAVEKMMLSNIQKDSEYWKTGRVRLSAIEDIYFMPTLRFDIMPRGSKSTSNILLAIAFLVVVIASINFVNFATSLTPLRIKSINTQKVLGSLDRTLRAMMVVESIAFAVIALVVAFFWVEILRLSGFSQYLLTGISFGEHILAVGMTIGVALAAGVLAGIYPAFYSTSFSPALVLKGSFGLTPRGKALRTTLVGIQFVVSMGLIMAAIFMQLQNSYLRSYKSGFDMEQIAIVELSDEMAGGDKKSLIVSQLKSSPLIEDVAFSQFEVGIQDIFMTWGRKFGDNEQTIHCLPVSWNFPAVMGLEITQGRTFNETDEEYVGGKAIFNEKVLKDFGVGIDITFQGHTDTATLVLGAVKDFNFKSLRYPIEPMMLYLYGRSSAWRNLGVAFIKISGNPFDAASHIERTVKSVDPNYPVDIKFYDTAFNELYKSERKTTVQITAFSLLAVIISLFGVFGIVVFETQFRRKEIGVRKVYGSTIKEILFMFNRRYVGIIVICALIATPLAYIGVDKWLSGFEYRIGIEWWVFVVATLIVALVTLITVTIQSYRAATENPINSIKSE